MNTASKTTVATAPKVQYVWDIRYIDALAVRWRDADGNGSLEEQLHYCQDANGNVTALVMNVSNVATIVERYNYDPYGNVTIYDAAWTVRATSSYANEIRFAGYRWDPETLLHYARHRTLHPTLGRWLERDPIRYIDGMNLYQYVRSTPVQYTDSLGLMTPNDKTAYCRALAEKIANIHAEIEKRERELNQNEGPKSGPGAGIPLPERPPFPGAPDRLSKDGHRKMIAEHRENLRKLEEDFRNNCIDKRTGLSLLAVPVTVPAPKPATQKGPTTAPTIDTPSAPAPAPIPAPDSARNYRPGPCTYDGLSLWERFQQWWKNRPCDPTGIDGWGVPILPLPTGGLPIPEPSPYGTKIKIPAFGW